MKRRTLPELVFERRHEQVASTRLFARRMAVYLGIVFLVVSMMLAVGVCGYHFLAGLGWVDSLLNASMILSGMGPVNPLPSNGAKVFASIYALFSGLVFIAVMGIVFTPVFHRLIHKFHVDAEPDAAASARAARK